MDNTLLLLDGGVKLKYDSAYSCLNSSSFNADYWKKLDKNARYETARAIGLNDKIALILYHGYIDELIEYYKDNKFEKIAKEVLMDWFLAKNYSSIKFDNFKFKTVREEINPDGVKSYRELEERDHDEIHTRFREEFPWAEYHEGGCYKKIVSFSQRNKVDTKIEYLNSLVAPDRCTLIYLDKLIEKLCVLLVIPQDEREIAKIYLRVWFAGIIHRTYNPGSKFDLVLIFNGAQGVGKTNFFESIFPGDTYTMSNSRDLDSKDKLVNLSTNSIIVWDEIGSFTSKYMIETIKQFLTLREDSFRPPWGRLVITRGRRCVFCATTNDPDILDDLTGNRRFMTLTVGKTRKIEHSEIEELVPSILALTRELYRAGTVKPYLNDEELVLQQKNNLKYEKEDPMFNLIEDWVLGGVDEQRKEEFTTADVALDCLSVPLQQQNKKLSCEINKVLRGLGMTTKRKRFGKVVCDVWVFIAPEQYQPQN